MKKSFLLFLFFSNVFIASAQYRGYATYDQIGNPGMTLNYISYGNYHVNGLTPGWDNVRQIPFPFIFNGQHVTSFKVSTTGVLTFDTAAVLAPPAMHSTLPNPQIPDKSICILGMNGSCTYISNGSSISYSIQQADIRSNPKRQLFINFVNFSDTIVTFPSRVLSWSIVLEEGTNNIYFIDQTESGLTPSLTLGIQINSSTAYMIPGSPGIGGHSPQSSYELDNIYYTFEPMNPVAIDGKIRRTNFFGYVDINDAPFTVKAEFRNLGSITINSYRLNYSFNGGPVVSEFVSGVNLTCGQTQWVTFPTSFSVPDTGEYFLDVWADSLNGFADQYTVNDHLIERLYVAPALPKRRVMCEEIKGDWCLWSGYWTQRYDSLLNVNKTKASSIKYETGAFRIPGNDSYLRLSFMGYYAVPTGYANGPILIEKASTLFPGCPHILSQSLIDSLYDYPGLFDIQPHLTLSGATISLNAGITSKVRFPPFSRAAIMVALYEDTLMYYGSNASGETLFVNTTRKLYPDAHGSYIGSPVFGQYDTLSFTDTILDPTCNPNRLHAVVFIQDTLTREIFQCAEVKADVSCPLVTNTTNYQICPGDSVLINGIWRDSTGTFPVTYASSGGCDSIQFNVVRLSGLFTLINAYGGQLYRNSWSYNNGDTLTWAWFDSTNQQVLPGPFTSPFTPPSPGTYACMLSNQFGCAVFSNYVHYCMPDTGLPQTYHICQGDTVYISDRKIYSNFNSILSLTQANGCGDSIIALNVTVTQINNTISYSSGLLSVTLGPFLYQWFNCDGTMLIGQSFNTLTVDTSNGGSFYCLITDTNNCTKATLCYTIFPINPQIAYNDINVCPGDSIQLYGQTFSLPFGPVVDTLTNSFGLDSIAVLTVTNNIPNTNVTGNVDSLISLATNVNYQWFDCDLGVAIPGANSQVFYSHTPGNYSVIVADGFCIDTSACIPFIWSTTSVIESNEFFIYPNPANEFLNLEMNNFSEGYIEIYNIQGSLVYFGTFQSGKIALNISKLKSGTYLIRARTASKVFSKVFVKV